MVSAANPGLSAPGDVASCRNSALTASAAESSVRLNCSHRPVVGQFENHAASVALWFMYYNFCRVHQTLRVTPAMEAGISDHVWSIDEVLQMAEPYMPKPGPRGPYKKRISN
jgi:hypothetical protein